VVVVSAFVTRDPAACWKLFTDIALLGAWVPGLRRAQVLAKEKGLPSEVHFEFASSLAYTLVYTYDPEVREVRWEPKLGRRDGVSGYARFEPAEGGTTVTYSLTQGEGRSAQERELANPQVALDALRAWLEQPR
jgi:hypothetical protein